MRNQSNGVVKNSWGKKTTKANKRERVNVRVIQPRLSWKKKWIVGNKKKTKGGVQKESQRRVPQLELTGKITQCKNERMDKNKYGFTPDSTGKSRKA